MSNNVKLGQIVFCSDSGLGNQSRRLAEMLNPERILAIDSSSFSKNRNQHFDWYKKFLGYRTNGFPKDHEIKVFLDGLTHVLVCENPLNFSLLSEAEKRGIKVFIQSNFEFCDHLNHPELSLPYKFLMPSYWKVQEMKDRFGADRVLYLPPPIDLQEFANAREKNLSRGTHPKKLRLMHIVGTLAAHDRNGTLGLIKAVTTFSKRSDDYELTIRSQHELPSEYLVDHKSIVYDIGNRQYPWELYSGFDALLLPRRYGGLSLTVNEALASALPVIMTNISPNNQLLPSNWLVRSIKTGEFQARVMIDIYDINILELAIKIDWLLDQDIEQMKLQAFKIGSNNFDLVELKEKYERLFV